MYLKVPIISIREMRSNLDKKDLPDRVEITIVVDDPDELKDLKERDLKPGDKITIT